LLDIISAFFIDLLTVDADVIQLSLGCSILYVSGQIQNVAILNPDVYISVSAVMALYRPSLRIRLENN